MESYYKQKVEDYLVKQGWAFHFPDKIRGMRPDFVVSKNGKIAMIEVKGERANMDNAIKQVLHLKNAANFAYLALPNEIISDDKIRLCKDLGIGLISIDEKTKEIVEPILTKGLKSVEKKILKTKSKKPKTEKKSTLELLFRSRTLIAILKILFMNQTKEYYLYDLASRAAAAPATVFRELERIQPLDIILKIKQGHIAYYKINKHCIIHNELKKIFLKFELADELISKTLKKFEIKYALIYGSFARGTETETSDLDLLIIGNVDRDSISHSISNLSSKIGREINFILWIEKIFQDKANQHISLLNNIKNNEIIMIRGDENEFKKTITRRLS